MNNVLDLKKIERKAFRSTFQDGLLDINLGLYLLIMCIGPWSVETGLPITWLGFSLAFLCLLSFLLFYFGKKFITIPRMGLLKPGPSRQRKINKLVMILIASALGGVVLLFFRKSVVEISGVPLPIFIFGIYCIIVFSLGAFLLDLGRLYFYGILYALTPTTGFAMKISGKLTTEVILISGIPSLIIIGTGIYVLVKFLRKYPKPDLDKPKK